MALFTTLLLGIFFIIGIIVIRVCRNYHIIENISVSLAAGAILALACFDLIPEIWETYGLSHIWLAIIMTAVGLGILMVLDKFVPEHGNHDSESGEGMAHIGVMAAIAIILHNILEGMTVFSITASDLPSGISLAIGVGLHNIPMGMLIYATLKHEHRRMTLFLLLSCVLSTFIGGLVMFLLHPILDHAVFDALTCITLGMVIFLIAFELLPSVFSFHKKLPAILLMIGGFFLVMMSHIVFH